MVTTLPSVRYMLDTNTVSFLLRSQHQAVQQHLKRTALADVCISAITEAELLYGLERKPSAVALARVVQELLLRVESVAWNSAAARSYARLRTRCEQRGTPLGNMDLLIASQAHAEHAVLVTNDASFAHLADLVTLVDWTR
jgi:tRNA(fMet)-specific endonuclease VapC